MTKTYALKPGAKRRVWIEWEYPSISDFKTAEAKKAAAEETCRLINNMLDRLCGEEKHSTLWWHDGKGAFMLGDNTGFVECNDNGHWFNLEFFGR